MSLIAKGTSFTPPPEGVWPAVCVDVVDLGMVQSTFGTKPKCRIAWEIAEKMPDGRPFIATKQYTVSLHEKATLHKDLKAWRGKAFTADEMKGFDIEAVLGAPCQLVITHEEKEGLVYGNVTAILRAQKNGVLKPTGKYIRHKDRPENKKDAPAPETGDYDNPNYSEDDPITNDDIPF